MHAGIEKGFIELSALVEADPHVFSIYDMCFEGKALMVSALIKQANYHNSYMSHTNNTGNNINGNNVNGNNINGNSINGNNTNGNNINSNSINGSIAMSVFAQRDGRSGCRGDSLLLSACRGQQLHIVRLLLAYKEGILAIDIQDNEVCVYACRFVYGYVYI